MCAGMYAKSPLHPYMHKCLFTLLLYAGDHQQAPVATDPPLYQLE
jgi:hypothetical protein